MLRIVSFVQFFGSIEETINCFRDLLTFIKHGISLGHVTASAVLSNFLPKRLSVCLLAYLCCVCLSAQALVARGSLKAKTIISSSTRVVGVKKKTCKLYVTKAITKEDGPKLFFSCTKNGVFFYSWQLRKRHHFWCS